MEPGAEPNKWYLLVADTDAAPYLVGTPAGRPLRSRDSADRYRIRLQRRNPTATIDVVAVADENTGGH